MTGTGPSAKRRSVALDLGVRAFGAVVEQRHPPCAGRDAQADGVLGRSVAEETLGLDLFGPEVRVVDEEVDPARQLERRLVVLADAVGPGPSAVGQWSGR